MGESWVARCPGSWPIVRDPQDGRLQGHGRGRAPAAGRFARQRLQAEAADEHAVRYERYRGGVISSVRIDFGFGRRVHLRGGAREVTPEPIRMAKQRGWNDKKKGKK